MDTELRDGLVKRLARATGGEVEIAEVEPVAGGSINTATIVELTSGERYFVKSHPSPPPYFFECESQGLEALAAVGGLRVPRVVAVAEPPREAPFLVLEEIVAGRQLEGFSECFGRRLAELHRAGAHPAGPRGSASAGDASAGRFGFTRDNYIGLTPQPNRWSDDWSDFWRTRRLGYQLDLARRRGLSDPTLDRLGDRLLDRLEELIDEPAEPACLLHGDLWSGNFMVDAEGGPVLVDPSVYYGRREADLAMTHLFGGFDPRFYAAYEEVWPLAPGAEDRLEIYKLYHLLNHLNLFGGGYLTGCIDILRRFA